MGGWGTGFIERQRRSAYAVNGGGGTRQGYGAGNVAGRLTTCPARVYRYTRIHTLYTFISIYAHHYLYKYTHI